jgi:hypothetical protein
MAAAIVAACGTDDDSAPNNSAGSHSGGSSGTAGAAHAGAGGTVSPNAGAGGAHAGAPNGGSAQAGSGEAGESEGGSAGEAPSGGGAPGAGAGGGGAPGAGAGGAGAGGGGAGGGAGAGGGGAGGAGGAPPINLCDKQLWKNTFQFCPHTLNVTDPGEWDHQPLLAVDGDLTTYVSSGKIQDGTFFALFDLHGAVNLSSLVLDYTGTHETDASAIALQASDDGTTFTAITGAVVGVLTAHKITVTIPSDVPHRYLKVLQQGVGTGWWAIPEVNLTCTTNGTPAALSPDAVTTRANWKVLTPNSPCTTDIAKVLDGDTATQWQSVGKPGIGYWIRVDLGTPTAITNVDIKASGTDFPAGVKLQVSSDDITYTDVKTGVVGAADTKIVLDAAVTKRFFRVVSTADTAGTKWWSINELDINVP